MNDNLPPPPPSSSSLSPGSLLGEIEIVKFLGEGGMGKVYQGYQSHLERTVAIKVLTPKLVANKQFVERFVREAQIAAKINHPNIVQVYDTRQYEGGRYLVMEFIDGHSLFDLIQKQRKIPPLVATHYILQVARGLEEIHDIGVLHRDIKPENILITSRDLAKLNDFGLAKSLDKSTISSKGSILGTVHYMSPEQVQGQTLDHRSDIYSLGATFYQSIFGHPPFIEKTPVDIMRLQVNTPLKFPDEDDIPDEVIQLIGKMMAKEPYRRHLTTKDLVADLETLYQWLKGETDQPSFVMSSSQPIPPKPPTKRPKFTPRKLDFTALPLWVYLLIIALGIGCIGLMALVFMLMKQLPA